MPKAETAKPTGAFVKKRALEIKPAMVKTQDAGQVYKTVVAWAPDDFQLSDLNEHPEMWKVIQNDRTGRALVEDDRVEIRTADKRINCRVNFADENKVYFYDIKQVDKPSRDVSLWADDNYEVRRIAEGYTYFRKSDNVRMGPTVWPTANAAAAACQREQYPSRVA
jgi:hypothetical protein